MSSISRGSKNAFRNWIRTVSVALIVGLSIGLALIMVLSVEAVQLRIDSVKGAIGSRITISPAGSVMGVGGAPLTQAQLGDLSAIPHVSKVVKTLSAQMMQHTDTSLNTSIANFSRPGMTMGGVTMPIFGQSTDSIADFKMTSGHDLKLTSGSLIAEKGNANEALVGKAIADKNDLHVGSTFTAYGTPVTVKGIFDTGNMWSNNVVLFPLATLERISQQPDQVSMVYVEVDSPDNIAGVQQAIQGRVGSAADMTTTGDLLNQAAGPLQDIKHIATQGLVGALVVGAVTIFLIMLMIVRERRREIGVLKAIGASGSEVVLQFMAEAFVLALLGALVGAIIGVLMTNAVFNQLVLNSHAGTSGQPMSASTLEVGFKAGWGAFSVVRGASNNLHATVGFGLVFWGLLVALLIAMLGSALPAWLISRIRPAEVLRGE